MSKKNVYLFQINYTVRVAGTDSLWLPYSIACLTAYAKQQKIRFRVVSEEQLFHNGSRK